MTKKFIFIAIAIGYLTIATSCKSKQPLFDIETVKIVKGTVSNNVTATGTVQAIKTVAVGTQVSGVIQKLYADFNSVVKKGQILAEIDKIPLLADLDNAQASLDDAKAEVTYQSSNYNRTKALFDKVLVAQSDYDLALYNYSKAQTTLKTALSNYNKAKINLAYATIYSPIDGVVLNRAVDEGQTVASSFNTPTLFSIANDLTQMQVAANIDEADIGQIEDKQKVEFTVDAFPDLKFTGEVTQIRLQSTTTSNVVTYTVIVKAPNPDFKLMPGMTATITIIVGKAENELLVPVKAIRFTPNPQILMAYQSSLVEKKSNFKNVLPKEVTFNQKDSKQTVWVKSGREIHAVPVSLGISDGIVTALHADLKEGDEVIVSMSSNDSETGKAPSGSPFMPHPPSDNRKK